MAKRPQRWTLEDLIDFEGEIAAATPTPPELRDEVLARVRGLEGAAARRAGLRVWLDGLCCSGNGGKFTSALGLVGAGLALAMFLAGISGVLGMLDPERGGVHVTLFLAILIGGQWLVLAVAAVAWLARGRAAGGLSMVHMLAGSLARRLAGEKDAPWWGRLMGEGGPARAALLWRLARLAQAAGISFNLGVVCGLAGLVLVRHVGFFWETTTEDAMFSMLERLVGFLSAPWAAWWPGAVPDGDVLEASLWRPGAALQPGPAAWWQFLLVTTLVWGLLPRLALWMLACRNGRRALAGLDFQARSHRALWRDLTGAARAESDDKPLDGVLVLDVGGSGISAESLRPFLLRHLRVHPAAWHPVAVLDAGAEQAATRALANAPAGVVLLAEGWSLSPARLSTLLAKIRHSAGPDVPVRFLVANAGPGNLPAPPAPDERREWERFVDSLRDPQAEVFFFEDSQPAV
jgi:hypothetical protein